ncbi:MAG TPA: hypothetical protein VMU27_01180 [Candidatus Paceibacterota bacterium]|nr:hypothetical protein [Candidatus Paceibacterota bacterium]
MQNLVFIAVLIILSIVLLASVPHIIQDNAFSEKFGIPIRRRDNPVTFWLAALLVFLVGASFLAISCLQITAYLSR